MRRLLRGSHRALCTLVFGLACIAGAGAQGVPTGTSHSVTLTWIAPTAIGGSGTIKGYNIYRTPSGPPTYTKLNTAVVVGLTLVDTAVTPGTQYGYCATTVDTLNEESPCTIPVSATVPSNPNPPTGLSATPQ